MDEGRVFLSYADAVKSGKTVTKKQESNDVWKTVQINDSTTESPNSSPSILRSLDPEPEFYVPKSPKKLNKTFEFESWEDDEYCAGEPVLPYGKPFWKMETSPVNTTSGKTSKRIGTKRRRYTSAKKTIVIDVLSSDSEDDKAIQEAINMNRISMHQNRAEFEEGESSKSVKKEKSSCSSESEEEPGTERRMYIDLVSSSSSSEKELTLSDATTSVIRYLNDDLSFPLYEMPDGEFSVTETARVLLSTEPSSNLVCQKRPIKVQKNCNFLVNCLLLKDRRDIRADDLGKWNHNGVITRYLKVKKNFLGDVIEISQQRKSFKPEKMNKDMFVMRRTYHKNGTAPDFKRMIVEMEDYKGSLLPICLIKYSFDGLERSFSLASHGNSKSTNREYVRTFPSTIAMLKHEAENCTPKIAVEIVDDANGGIMESDSAGSLPRNRQQVSNLRRSLTESKEKRSKNVKGTRDELAAVMEMCLNQSRVPETAFVRKVQGAPDTMCILATDNQLRELERNTTNPATFKIVSVDPTFNLGAFDVTVMTHQHGLLINKRTGKHPIVMGPILVHQRKQFSNYYYFMSSLVELRPSLSEIQAFGTDGEVALQQGLSKPCPNSRLLRCFSHFKSNIKDKLSSIGVPKQCQKDFMHDIFGYNVGATHHEGLVDSDDRDVFQAKLKSLEEKWNKLEGEVKETNNSQPKPTFHQWFSEKKAKDMEKHMLASLRKEAGLGSPPTPYYQNNSECMNEVIKDQMNYQENELPEFLDKLTGIVTRHDTLLRKAIARTGEWELLPGFRFLERPDWFQMTPEQRDAHMKTVMGVELTEDRTIKDNLPQPISLPLLSLGYENIPNISEFTLKKIWKDAKELVGSPGFILPVAGCECPFARQVYNAKQPTRPLVVTLKPAKKKAVGHNFVCDSGCSQYAYLKLCCHTVATAEANCVLKEYKEFLEKNTDIPNLHLISKVTTRDGTGRKGGQPTRKRKRAAKPQPTMVTSFPGIQSKSPTFPLGSESPLDSQQHLRSSEVFNDVPSVTHHSQQLQQFEVQHQPIQHWNNLIQQEHQMYGLYGNSFATGSAPVYSNQMQQQQYHWPYTFLTSVQQQQQQQQRTTQSIPKPLFPSPAEGVFQLYLLTFCPKKVSKCYGCSQVLKPGQQIGQPPNDLVVVGKMNREYPTKDGGKGSNVQNVYFHCRKSCIQRKQPYFTSALCEIPAQIRQLLLPVHHDFIKDFFNAQ